jgi:hypothetical protein
VEGVVVVVVVIAFTFLVGFHREGPAATRRCDIAERALGARSRTSTGQPMHAMKP